MNREFCFWTVANGDEYECMAESLAYSLKEFQNEDLHVFAKRPLRYCKTYDVGKFVHNRWLFKFDYLLKLYSIVNSDYYIFLDTDSLFVKRAIGLEDLIRIDPMHIFLENKLEGSNRHWSGGKDLDTCRSNIMKLSKKDRPYYNVNGGFWSFRRDIIPETYQKITEAKSFFEVHHSNYHDEFILSYLAGEWIDNDLPHMIENNFHIWGIDTGYYFKGGLPRNEYWDYGEWFGSRRFKINPAIIHSPNSKPALVNYSKNNFKTLKPFFNIIIACSRLFNLPIVISSIEEQAKNNVDYKIIVVFDFLESEVDQRIISFCQRTSNLEFHFSKDPVNKSSGGNAAKNYAIDRINEGWVYQLDDDNILYPNFFIETSHLINSNIEKECLIFAQDKRYTPESNNIRAGIIDTAMYLINRSFISDSRIPHQYGGDGLFIESLYQKNPSKCLVTPKILSYYNKLERK